MIFGLVFSGNRYYNIFRLANEDFDESGLTINGTRTKVTWEYEDDDGDEDSDETEDLESESDRVSCSGNESTASTASGEDEDEEGGEGLDEPGDLETESESDRLSCSSDDSSASTASNPRRKPDADLLSKLTPAMRDKVEYLRKALPGCPADHCRNMLIKTNGDREAARRSLFRRFAYTQVGCLVRKF